MESSRLKYIDIAKGIGILLVILGHCMAYGCQYQVFRCIYSFHMPLFFILSGYVFHSKEMTSFFSGKIKTLLLPVIFFQTLNIISYVVLYGSGYIIEKDLTSYHHFISFGGFWFVITLLYVSSLYYVIYEKIAYRFNTKHLFMFCIALFFLLMGLIYAPHIADKPNEPIATTMTAFFFYTCGSVVKQFFQFLNTTWKSRLSVGCIGFALLALCFYLNGFSDRNVDYNTSRYIKSLPFVINALLGSFAVFGISFAISKAKIIEWYGKNSLLLLFVHIPIWKSFDTVLVRMTDLQGGEKSLTVFIISLLLGTLGVWLINRYIPWMIGTINFEKTNTNANKLQR